MHTKKYFKINEFAKLCHTSKDTLLHYDKKNLLKPKFIAANGYRYYGIEQFFRYDLITMLKDTGSTLEEIKHYLNSSPSDMVQIIRERIILMEQERQNISRKIAMLSTLTNLTEQSLQKDTDRIFFEQMPKETLRILSVDAVTINSPKNLAVCYSECLLECLLYGNNIDPPLGMMIEKKHIAEKKFAVRYLFTRNLERAAVKSKIMPKGTYACFLHKGNIPSHENAFLNFLSQLEENNVVPKSDVFLFNQMNYLIDGHDSEFFLKYAVKAEGVPGFCF